MVFGLGWTLFSLIFVVVGLSIFWKEQGNENWKKVPCTIERFEITANQKEDPPFRADLKYRYAWEGKEFTGTKLYPKSEGKSDYEDIAELRETLRAEGHANTCLVNAANPQEAALVSDESGRWFGLLFAGWGGMFVAIGITMMTGSLRGRRRLITHSDSEKQSGTVFGLIFCSIFGLAGFGILFGVVLPKVRDYWTARNWTEVPGEVIWSRVISSHGKSTTYRPEVFYRYTFQGHEYRSNRYELFEVSSSGYEGKQDVVAAHPPKSKLTCYVDPAKPWRAVVERKVGWSGLFALFPLPFIAVGVGGFWSFLRQRRATGVHPATISYENGKREVTLRHSMAPSQSRNDQVLRGGGKNRLLQLLGSLFFAAFWNGIVSVFVGIAIQAWMKGRPEWFLNIFLIPFVAIGLYLLFFVFYSFLRLFSPKFEMRLSSTDLTPGSGTTLHWSRRGGMGRPTHVSLYLVGLIEVSYRSGKHNKTEKEVFHEAVLFQTDSPLSMQEGKVQLAIPSGTMPTFTGRQNKIRWLLRMHAVTPVLPDTRDEFEIHVRPLRRDELP